MNDERPNAVALVAGWIGLLAVMAFHPTGQALLLPGRSEPASRLAIAVHGLALLCAPVVVFGALGLTRRLRAPDGLALLALLSFVAAQVAGGVAAVFGGSNVQVSGPTGAMTVVLVPVVARYGTDAVFLVGVIAGVLIR